jgi:Fe-S cluster assembly protein SufD
VLSINTALLALGVFIYVPAGVLVDAPLALVHVQDQNQQAVYVRHLIVCEAQSEITVVEHYQGAQECSYLTNTITEVSLGACAKMTHYKVQQEGKAAYHLGHVAAQLGSQSHFVSHSLCLGAKLARSDTAVYLKEEQAHCILNGIYAPASGQHVDHHTSVYHLVPNCVSEQDYKGMLQGRSCAVFNGKVFVAKDAQHSDAKQQNKNLLLSPQAQVNTKPQLEIFADDVLCSHGATVGQLDEEALFYLATRGIARDEASHYLIHAFAQDNLRVVADKALANWMEQLVSQHVG